MYVCMLTLRLRGDGRLEAVHVVATVAIVAEEQLIVVLRGATEVAGLAFDALPAIGADHVGQRG